MHPIVLYWLLLFAPFQLLAQVREEVKDIKEEWKVYEAGVLTDYQNRSKPHRAVHLLPRESWRGSTLKIEGEECDIFINGKLMIAPGSNALLNVDSLLSRYDNHLLISIYSRAGVSGLKTQLIKLMAAAENANVRRSKIFFDDFVIISLLALLVFFVTLYRTHTHLTLDYFNIAKLFSFQAREEAITTGRIGSSANLFFFVFIALLGSVLLIIILQEGAPAVTLWGSLPVTRLGGIIAIWLLLAALILVGLFIKLVAVLVLSWLFNFRDVVRFQFFNFVRSLYVAQLAAGILAIGYYIVGIESPRFFYFLLFIICALLFLNTFFLYFKLMPRAATAGFHLFSYLCGSEIIPLMILIKVLLF
jgi:hypothetical protein